jgi:hypothetical protein
MSRRTSDRAARDRDAAPTEAKFLNRDPRLVSTMQVVGSYFVDTFFNVIYNSARQSAKAAGSVTSEYTKSLNTYVVGVKTDARCYGEVIRDVHQRFVTTTRHSSLTFADFVDRIVSAYVPESYHKALNNEDKDELLSSIVCDLVSGLAVYCTTADLLSRIIDYHDEQHQVTIRMMQEQAVDIQLMKHTEMHNSFLQKIGQARSVVPMDIVADMKKALRRLVREKTEIEAENSDLTDQVERLRGKVREGRAREAKFQRLVELMQAQMQGRAANAALKGYVRPPDTTGELASDEPAIRREEGGRVRPRDLTAERSTHAARRHGDSMHADEEPQPHEVRIAEEAREREREARPAATAVLGGGFFKGATVAVAPRHSSGAQDRDPPRAPAGRSIPQLSAAKGIPARPSPAKFVAESTKDMNISALLVDDGTDDGTDLPWTNAD